LAYRAGIQSSSKSITIKLFSHSIFTLIITIYDLLQVPSLSCFLLLLSILLAINDVDLLKQKKEHTRAGTIDYEQLKQGGY
jgi:1,4-dihydroxy-2-naphthoate octaprenyltransferase